MDAVRRKETVAALARLGVRGDYIDSWPPKVDLYRHTPFCNTDGNEIHPVGTLVVNQPGHPEHLVKASRRGLLQWPPSETCECKACRERYGTERSDRHFMSPEQAAAQAHTGIETPARGPLACDVPGCGFVTRETSKSHPASLRMHRRAQHNGQ